MPPLVRPLQPSDVDALRERFGRSARAPWLPLPSPYFLDQLLEPSDTMDVLVVAVRPEQAVGLLGIDRATEPPTLVGPLVSDEQLADLTARALLEQAFVWSARQGLSGLSLQVRLGETRALSFFLSLGFQRLAQAEHVYEAASAELSPVEPPDGFTFQPRHGMLSSDYLRLVGQLEGGYGRERRIDWPRAKVFEHLQRPEVHVVTAKHGAEEVGLAELQRADVDTAEIEVFGVVPGWRTAIEGPFIGAVLQLAGSQWGYSRVRLRWPGDRGELPAAWLRHGFREMAPRWTLYKALGPQE